MELSPQLRTVIDFVEGRMPPGDFEQRLHADAGFESLLAPHRVQYLSEEVDTTAYLYLLGIDYRDPGEVLNAHAVLKDFLAERKVPSTPTGVYAQTYDLILGAMPEWLDVDPRYVQDSILPGAGDRRGDDLRQWLREQFEERFRYVQAPPDWIQSPSRWPVGPGGPYVFLGQFDVSGYFHDLATVYVFHDRTTGDFHTVSQCF